MFAAWHSLAPDPTLALAAIKNELAWNVVFAVVIVLLLLATGLPLYFATRKRWVEAAWSTWGVLGGALIGLVIPQIWLLVIIASAPPPPSGASGFGAALMPLVSIFYGAVGAVLGGAAGGIIGAACGHLAARRKTPVISTGGNVQ